MNKADIIKEIEDRIYTWKEDRRKIDEGVFKHCLYDKQIDHSIDDIVIVELTELLRFVIGEKDE